jgi:hypothetical protein
MNRAFIWRKNTKAQDSYRIKNWEGEKRKLQFSATTEMPNAVSIRQEARLHRLDVGIAGNHMAIDCRS